MDNSARSFKSYARHALDQLASRSRLLPEMLSFIITKHQGPVVRKPVKANLGLKFIQGSCFSYFKRIFTAKGAFESNQSQSVGQKRFTGIGIVWL